MKIAWVAGRGLPQGATHCGAPGLSHGNYVGGSCVVRASSSFRSLRRSPFGSLRARSAIRSSSSSFGKVMTYNEGYTERACDALDCLDGDRRETLLDARKVTFRHRAGFGEILQGHAALGSQFADTSTNLQAERLGFGSSGHSSSYSRVSGSKVPTTDLASRQTPRTNVPASAPRMRGGPRLDGSLSLHDPEKLGDGRVRRPRGGCVVIGVRDHREESASGIVRDHRSVEVARRRRRDLPLHEHGQKGPAWVGSGDAPKGGHGVRSGTNTRQRGRSVVSRTRIQRVTPGQGCSNCSRGVNRAGFARPRGGREASPSGLSDRGVQHFAREAEQALVMLGNGAQARHEEHEAPGAYLQVALEAPARE